MNILLAVVSPTTTHPDTAQTAKVIFGLGAGLALFLIGCWILAKSRR